MTAPSPLKGLELIDCARANGNQGIEVAAYQCGYGQDIEKFEQELKQACEAINIEFSSFADLIPSSLESDKDAGVIIAPDTANQL